MAETVLEVQDATEKSDGLNLSVRSFIAAIVIIFLLMSVAYVLNLILTSLILIFGLMIGY